MVTTGMLMLGSIKPSDELDEAVSSFNLIVSLDPSLKYDLDPTGDEMFVTSSMICEFCGRFGFPLRKKFSSCFSKILLQFVTGLKISEKNECA